MVNIGKPVDGQPNRGFPVWLVSVVMVIVAGLLVIARIARRISRRALGSDDYTIAAALVSSVLLSITEIMAVQNGYGMRSRDLSRDQILTALKWFYGAHIMYKTVITFNKVSILCLYLRIFSADRNFRYTCHAWNLIVASSGIAYILGTVFQCTPIAAFWDRSIVEKRCHSNVAWWMSYSILNIVTDVALLVLPFRQIMKLKLPLADKLALSAVFLLGIFVCITTIIRATTLASSANDPDQTWGPIPATIWSVVEANTGTICACLPTLRHPIFAFISRIFSNNDSHSAEQRPGYELSSETRMYTSERRKMSNALGRPIPFSTTDPDKAGFEPGTGLGHPWIDDEELQYGHLDGRDQKSKDVTLKKLDDVQYPDSVLERGG